MIVLNSLFPVFTLIVLGVVLKRLGITHDGFLKTADKLIYFIFFPAMLFWKIGGASSATGINWAFCSAVFSALGVIYLVSALAVKLFKLPDFKVGSFSQSCYRFNTYIGMAVIINAVGSAGVREFGIMIGFAIPVINVIAVSTLIWHSGERRNLAQRIPYLAKALVSNPLIIGCLAGLLYARTVNAFAPFVDNTFQLMSMVTLPLALISIGGALTFDNMKGNLPIALLAAVLKLALLPVCGYLFMHLFDVTGVAFKTGMIFFCLPTSTALYVLSSQLNSDTQLASAAIVVSTVLSFGSLSVALLM